MSSSADVLVSLLAAKFPADRSAGLVKHYELMLDELQRSHWESATVKAGKFVEAVLKAIWEHVGEIVPPDKDFKVGRVIDQLASKAAPDVYDSVRLTVPRLCRFVYEVSSNRGARHDSSELDPNVMDANGTSSACSWILAELIRYSQRGRFSPPQAAEMVAKLSQKKYPLFEEIQGRVYFANSKVGARKLALLLLAYRYPSRVNRDDLITSVMRHGESKDNARKGVWRLSDVIDDDGAGSLGLRAPGLAEAEGLLSGTFFA